MNRGIKSERGSGTSIRKVVARTIAHRRLRAVVNSIFTGRFADTIPDYDDDDLPQVDVDDEPADEAYDYDPDYDDTDDNSSDQEDYSPDLPSNWEVIENIAREELRSSEGQIELDFDTLVKTVAEYAQTESKRGRHKLIRSVNPATTDLIVTCASEFLSVKKDWETPSNPVYIEVRENPEGNLQTEVIAETEDILDGLERLNDQFDCKHLFDPDDFWPNDSITPQQIRENEREFLKNLDVISKRLIELQRDFFLADDLRQAQLTLLGDDKPKSWQFLDKANQSQPSDDQQSELSTRIAIAYADVQIVCRHGTFPLRTFYINSGAPWYRIYLPAILMEEILILAPPLPKGTGEIHGGLYNITKVNQRVEQIVGSKEHQQIKSNTLSYEFKDSKRHRAKESQTDIIMGAYPGCRTEMINYVWQALTSRKDLSVDDFEKIYKPALKEGRVSTKHPEARKELFEPEKQIYFFVAAATIEMINRLRSQPVITDELIINELQSTLSELLYEEGIMTAIPDYAGGTHGGNIENFSIVGKIRENLTSSVKV